MWIWIIDIFCSLDLVEIIFIITISFKITEKCTKSYKCFLFFPVAHASLGSFMFSCWPLSGISIIIIIIINIYFSGAKLIDIWLGKGQLNLRVKDAICSNKDRGMAEKVVAFLLIDGFLKEDFHFTPYSAISYIVPG